MRPRWRGDLWTRCGWGVGRKVSGNGTRFVATCPAPPGLVTEGDTLEEAREMAHDAIRAYLESLRKDYLPIPADCSPVQEEIRVPLSESA